VVVAWLFKELDLKEFANG